MNRQVDLTGTRIAIQQSVPVRSTSFQGVALPFRWVFQLKKTLIEHDELKFLPLCFNSLCATVISAVQESCNALPGLKIRGMAKVEV